MGKEKSLALLLKKTPFANDDTLLEFFTEKWGRISVFAKQFARSKKRSELDFFRLLEIEVFQGRQSKSLQSVQTLQLFPFFESNLRVNEIGWKWISLLITILPSEQEDSDLFKEIFLWFSLLNSASAEWANMAFYFRMLQLAGDCPRFDTLRESCFFDPYNKTLVCQKDSQCIFLSNEARQVCEFLRRSTPDIFYEKFEKIPQNALLEVQSIILCFEENLF